MLSVHHLAMNCHCSKAELPAGEPRRRTSFAVVTIQPTTTVRLSANIAPVAPEPGGGEDEPPGTRELRVNNPIDSDAAGPGSAAGCRSPVWIIGFACKVAVVLGSNAPCQSVATNRCRRAAVDYAQKTGISDGLVKLDLRSPTVASPNRRMRV